MQRILCPLGRGVHAGSRQCDYCIHRTLSIRRNWTNYVGIIFEDGTLASTKGGRAFCRTLAHGAFYAGARSTLQVLAYMLEHGDIEGLHRTIAQQGRQIKVITGLSSRKRRH